MAVEGADVARLSDDERASRLAGLHGVPAAGLVMALREARIARMSQRGLADVLGVGPHAVECWEIGIGLPTVRHLFGWARAVGLRVVLVDRYGTRLWRSVEPVDGEGADRLEVRRAGAVLQLERERLHLYQADVAAETGVSLITVKRGERRGPGWMKFLLSWAAVLGCSVHVAYGVQLLDRGWASRLAALQNAAAAGGSVSRAGNARLSHAERVARMAALEDGAAAGLVLALRQARMDGGLTQRGLAEVMGIAAPTVRGWESGTDLPKARSLFGWALAVGCRLVLADPTGVRLLLELERRPGEDPGRFEARRVGAILRRERDRLLMTQPEMAELAGMSLSSVCRGELRGPGTGALLVTWAAALGCSVLLVRDRQDPAGV